MGREQALQYAQKIRIAQGGQLPFVFYSNGHDTFSGMRSFTLRKKNTALRILSTTKSTNTSLTEMDHQFNRLMQRAFQDE